MSVSCSDEGAGAACWEGAGGAARREAARGGKVPDALGTSRQALLLTCMGAAGTALGGLLVVVQPKMNFRRLGVMQVGGTRWR